MLCSMIMEIRGFGFCASALELLVGWKNWENEAMGPNFFEFYAPGPLITILVAEAESRTS